MHFTRFLGFYIALIHQLIKNISAADCPYGIIEILPSIAPWASQIVDSESLSLYSKPLISYSLWYKYEPYLKITQIGSAKSSEQKTSGSIEPDASTFTTTLKYFINSEVSANTGQMNLVHYVEFQVTAQAIVHYIRIQGQMNLSILTFTFDSLAYEGKWFLFTIVYDIANNQIKIIFTSAITGVSNIKTINDKPVFPPRLSINLGGTSSYQDGQTLVQLNQFIGKVSALIYTDTTNIIPDIANFITECKPAESCSETNTYLIKGEQSFTGLNHYTFISPSIQNSKYVIAGWVKLNSLTAQQKDSTLLRITLNENYQDDYLIGDRVLYIKYIQSQVAASNGIIVQTYSYQYPINSQYTTQSDDIQSYYASDLQIALTQWHFIQFEYGRSDVSPQFRVLFPQYSIDQTFSWNINIYHFTESILYIVYGGDKFAVHNLSGSIANLQWKYCLITDSDFLMKCHYSCLTCFGPNDNNCQTCSDTRQLQNNACICNDGYIDQDDSLQCIALSILFPSISEQITTYSCTQTGYEICDISGIQCQLGYFIYDNTCVRCPEQLYQQSKIILQCANCILNPLTWQNNLNCIYNLETYESNNLYTYQQQDRTYKNYYEVIKIDDHYQTRLKFGFANYYETQPGFYYLSASESGICFQGCSTCTTDSICTSCFSGYALTIDHKCSKCPSNCEICEQDSTTFDIVCTTCVEKYVLNSGSCVACGYKCSACTIDGCLYCEDPTLYYVSFDGLNCRSCTLDNCKYCFEYLRLSGKLYTNFDQSSITGIDASVIKLQVGCSYCKNGKYISTSTFLCVDPVVVLPPPPPDSGSTDPIVGGATTSSTTTVCTQGLVRDNANVCLIDNNDSSAIQTQGKSIENCSQMIESYNGSAPFCMKCSQGYYASTLLGTCSQCGTSCIACEEQQIDYQDSWKWEIRAFYKSVINQSGSHSYLDNATSDSQVDYEVKCTECQQGYIVYNGNCITGCSLNCLDCQIVNGLAVCISCPTQLQQSTKTQRNGQCLQCPKYCDACSAREELYNSYFDGDDYLSYQCYESDQYIDQFGFVSKCDDGSYCQRTFKMEFNVYCDQEEYNIRVNEAGTSAVFARQNIYIQDMFSNSQLLESRGLYSYMNEKNIRKIDMILTLYQGNSKQCLIGSYTSFSTYYRNNVYSVKEVNLIIQGSTQQTKLTIYDYFTLSNFTNITLQNLIIDTQNSDLFLPSLLRIQSAEPVKLNFTNIQLTSSDYTSESLYTNFQISLQNSNSIYLTNVSIINYYAFTLDSFIQMSSQSFNLLISDFKFINCTFVNSSLFLFQALTQSFSNQITINTLIFQNVSLINTNFLETKHIGSFQTGTLEINTVQITQLQLSNSKFIVTPSLTNCKLNNITINNSILTNATFIQTNIVKLYIFTALNISLSQSVLIVNSADYTENTEAVNQAQLATLSQIQFIDISYNQKQSLIQLLQHTFNQFEISIDDLLLSNVLLSSTNTEKMSYELSSIFIKGNKLSITNLQLFRAHGYPEFTFFIDTELTLENINATLLSNYFTPTVNYYLTCIEENSYLDQYFIFYIGDYKQLTLNYLKFDKIISFNYPLIIAIGKPILQIEQEETINITNSYFSQNMLLVTKSNVLNTIIYISSSQQTTMNISNCEFQYNHLHQYFQDISKDSSTTLTIKLEQGTLNLENSIFYRNLVTNSTNSILSFSAETIIFQVCYFSQNNIINKAILAQNLFARDNEIIEEIGVSSYSGNGILTSHNILMNKTKVTESFSLTGGGFYIVAMGNGIISIDNSEFTSTFTSLKDTAQSMGGVLYIDGSKAQIQFTLKNSYISDAHSRLQGGAIMIDPSKTYNKIEIINCDIRNTYSLAAGFIMFQCSLLSTSELFLKNLIIENSESGFYEYLGYLEELQSSESISLSVGSLIISSYCNVIIEDVKFQNSFLQYQMQFTNINSISLRNMQIFNTTLFYAPILSVSPRSTHQIYFKMNTIDIQNTTEIYSSMNETQDTCNISDIDSGDTSCPTELITLEIPIESEAEINFEETLKCNKNSLFSTSTKNISLFQLDNFQSTDRIYIYDIKFENNTCTRCSTGMMLLNVQQTPIIFKELLLDNNNCGDQGCLSILNTLTARLLMENQDYLQYQLSPTLVIQDGTFSQNIGSALFIDKLDVLIRDCIIRGNVANEYGGGLQYKSSSTQLHIFESLISGNKAKYGPGIYLTSYQLPKLEALGVNLIDNVGTMETSDAFEKPRSLALMFNRNFLNKKVISQNDSLIIEQVVVEPYNILGYSTKVNFIHIPTGQRIDSYQYFDPYQMAYISYNFTFRILLLNKYEEKQILFDNDSYCSLYAQAINPDTGEYVEYNQTFLSQDKVYFNHTSGDFNLDSLIVYFSPYAKEVLQLKVNCTPISIPIYESTPPYSFKGQVDEYKLLINLQTFQCQMGEYFNLEEQACVLCDVDQNQYSVTVGATQCSVKNDIQMTSIESSMIQLREGFWRPYLSSSVIEECYHLKSNCLGGWIPGDDSCTYGHIGALCEQCDLYNIQGNGSFSVSEKYSCGDCASITGNSLSIALVSIWTLISIMMSVSSTIETIQEFLIGLSLKPFKVTVILASSSSAILIKMFTNYLQIISTISTFQLTVPPYLASAVNGVGNPIETMAYSLDCFLIQMSDINIIYLRIIWGLLLSFIYIITFLSFYTIGIYLKKLLYNVSFITTTFIYIYIYLQPNLVGGLVSLLSYRLISEIYWIQGNVAYRYDSTQHSTWLIGFVMPTLFVLAFLVPFFFFIGLYVNRFRLDRISTRKIWGYLYNEYKKAAYFWEIIKILLKEFMIIVLTYYEDYIPIKSSLIFLALFIYSWITTIQKPYMTSELNNLDSRSTVVCAVSIVFAATIYSAQQADLQEIVWPFYILIFVFNAYFIVHLLYKILYAYVIKLQQELDKVKIFIIKKYPSLKEGRFSPYLETYTDKKQRLSSRFAKVRQYLLKQAKSVLEFRKSQGFELPCRMLEESQISSHSNNSNSHSGQLNLNSPQSEQAFTLRQAAKVFPTDNNEKIHLELDQDTKIKSLTRQPIPKPIEYKIQQV